MANQPNPKVVQMLKELHTAKQSKGSISIEDMTNILEKAVETESAEGASFALIKNEIAAIAQQLAKARGELSQMGKAEGDQAINEASQHLDAVIKDTEEATNKIMDGAEAIQAKVAAKDEGWEGSVNQHISEIFEACNFQDLTGQRISKVLKTLQFVEEKTNRLQSLLSGAGEEVLEMAATPKQGEREDEDLCNGPQLDAVSQEDIDALFSSNG